MEIHSLSREHGYKTVQLFTTLCAVRDNSIRNFVLVSVRMQMLPLSRISTFEAKKN